MDTNQDADFNEFVRSVVAEEIQKKNPGQVTQNQSEPLEINVAGQKLAFKDRAELEQALNTFVSQQATNTQQLQQQLNELQGAKPNNQNFVSGTDAPSWSDEAFIEKMTKAPKEAMEYAFNQLLFDGKSQDPVNDIKRSFEEMELTKRSIAAYQFKETHPEFPGGAEYAQKIDQIRQQMNLPYDVTGLEAAYLMGINKGVLPNFYQSQNDQQQQSQQQQQMQQIPQQQQQLPQGYNPYQQYPQQQVQQNPYMQAPPGTGRNNTTTWQPDFDPEKLSPEQIEAIFERAGKPVQKSRW